MRARPRARPMSRRGAVPRGLDSERTRDRAPIYRATLDIDLLSGFGFSCIPGCGLCCFTSPRLAPGDETPLVAAHPEIKLATHGAERCIVARPRGGACQFLSGTRCEAHPVRPAPCREFPVSVHIGTRLQATVVLSCPGVPVEPLIARSVPGEGVASVGFHSELESVRARISREAGRRIEEATRRRRRILRELDAEGRWVDEERVRTHLGTKRLAPSPAEYAPEDPPFGQDDLELLPMYYDQRSGPVALAKGLGGWEARELSAEGGYEAIGVVAPPDRRPVASEDAEALLEAYLRYVLARDSFLAAVHLELAQGREGSVMEAALEDLHAVGSLVLARGSARAKLRGNSGVSLGRDDIERGIRATDLDWLDRPTWGSRL